MAKIRLDKFLSELEIATRSQIKVMLKKQNVSVNGNKVTDGAVKIDADIDKVTIDGRLIKYTQYIYIMLNKPPGVVTATKDNIDRTVMDLLDDSIPKKSALSPVGRLDKDTTGLLLITNDGELNHRLLSPKHHVEKQYYAVLDEKLSDYDKACRMFEEGVDIGDDKPTLPARLEKLNAEKGYYITITEGRFHQVKRMFNTLGRTVVSLKRLTMGSLVLDKKLSDGDFRYLTEEEIQQLKNYKRK